LKGCCFTFTISTDLIKTESTKEASEPTIQSKTLSTVISSPNTATC